MKITLKKLPKNKPLALEYGVYKTALGTLLIISWQKSLVSVAFAAGKKDVLKEVAKLFPKGEFTYKENSIHKQVLAFLKAPKKYNKTFSAAAYGTPFQIKVWQALLKTPFGKTCFYSDLAKALKKPRAVRAVASAVAKNPLAILIPCHRVLPRSGGVGKYHWGTKNKTALLTWESLGSKK